jgi:hypothetical protein
MNEKCGFLGQAGNQEAEFAGFTGVDLNDTDTASMPARAAEQMVASI